MRIKIGKMLVVFCFMWCVVPLGFAQEVAVSSKELIDGAKKFDGSIVLFEGEVIGDIMKRGTFTWVNIHDGINALGCWIPHDMASTITHTGNYKTKGDWVAVRGEFHRACLMHGGDLDIHVQELKLVRSGAIVIERLNTAKRNTVFILAGLLCLVLILMRFKKV